MPRFWNQTSYWKKVQIDSILYVGSLEIQATIYFKIRRVKVAEYNEVIWYRGPIYKTLKNVFCNFFKIHVISNTIGRKRLKQERMDESIYQAFVDFERRKPSSTPSLFNFLITQFWRANKAPLILYPLCLLLPVSYQASIFYETDHFLAPEEMGGGGCHNKIYLISPLPQRLCNPPPHLIDRQLSVVRPL